MNELTVFIRESLSAGHSRSEIHAVLEKAGWPDDEIADALSRFADVEFPIAVPRRKQSGSAREAFLYLVTFMALYIFTIAIGSLLFGMVDNLIPDRVADRYSYGDDQYQNEGFRWAVASIIVSFPLYLGLTRMHLLSYVRDPERRTSGVRRWLTYLTLFVAASVIIGTLIALIGNILGGELVSRIVLKLVVAMLISAAVMAYYLWEMRQGEKAVPK